MESIYLHKTLIYIFTKGSATKRNRCRARRKHQVDPGEEEDTEVAFRPETDPT